MSKIVLKESKSPLMVIYGKIIDSNNVRIKGKYASYLTVQSLNRRNHKILLEGRVPTELLGEDVYRSFVVQEKSRVETEMVKLVDKKIEKVMKGQGSVLSYKMTDKVGNSVEKNIPMEIEASDIYVQKRETITDWVIVDIKLNPQSI